MEGGYRAGQNLARPLISLPSLGSAPSHPQLRSSRMKISLVSAPLPPPALQQHP